MFNNVIKSLLLFFSAVLIFFLLAEVITRAIMPNGVKFRLMHQPAEKLGFRLVPNFEMNYKTSEFDTIIKINADGLRDYKHQKDKHPSTYRILVIGDSFTLGLGVNVEDSYTKILEKMLNYNSGNRSKERYEVINAGVDGYGTHQEYYYLQELGPRYKPDLVIVGFYPLDIHDVAAGIRSPLIKTKYKNHFYFLSYLRTRQIILLNMFPKKFRPDFPLLYQDQYPSYLDDAVKETKEYLGKICDFTQSIGAKTLIVIIPFCLEVDRSQWEYKGKGDKYSKKIFNKNMSKVSDTFSTFGKTHKIYTLPLLPIFRDSQLRQQLYYKRDPHWTKEGHRLAAKAIFNTLKQITTSELNN